MSSMEGAHISYTLSALDSRHVGVTRRKLEGCCWQQHLRSTLIIVTHASSVTSAGWPIILLGGDRKATSRCIHTELEPTPTLVRTYKVLASREVWPRIQYGLTTLTPTPCVRLCL
jgi:hypothetical protein